MEPYEIPLFLSVQTIRDSICHTCDFIKAQGLSGYISSLVTSDTGCGSAECPWRIAVEPGQRIRVTLHDYGSPSSGTSIASSSPTLCTVYAVLKEGNPPKSMTVCGGTPVRHREVHISQTNILEVRILKKSNQEENHFLLHYESKWTLDRKAALPGLFSLVRDLFQL